jgi:hypothetical protein
MRKFYRSIILPAACAGILAACGSGNAPSPDLSDKSQTKQIPRSDKTQAAASNYASAVQELYISYYGRPADPAGLRYWEGVLANDNAPTTLQGINSAYSTVAAVRAVVNSFGNSAESQALYGGGTTTQFVTAIYNNALGRAPDSAGLAYWVGLIADNKVTQAQAAMAIIAGAASEATTSSDEQVVANRQTVASYFTNQLTSSTQQSAYSGLAANATARTMLADVTATTNTISFESTVNETIAALCITVTAQPVATSVAWSASATLSVAATGTSALSYQWYLDNVALYGQTSSTLTISHAAASDAGNYYVVITDGAGDKLASATVPLTVTNLSQDTSATESSNRVIVVPISSGLVQMPSWNTNWELKYLFTVPPLPTGTNWNPSTGSTFYIWGDVDFDSYGINGSYPLSSYVYNQIVPQLFLGDVLSGNNANFNPSWTLQSQWAIQAQYYWQNGNTPYAQTGSIVYVNPGDVITETIDYNASTGAITATIAADEGSSSIVIPRPFEDQPTLFQSWADFFKQAQAASGGSYVLANPAMNIEPHGVDMQTTCQVLPFVIDGISMPGIGSASADYAQYIPQGFPCSTPMVQMNF